jgi:hypothetical protein
LSSAVFVRAFAERLAARGSAVVRMRGVQIHFALAWLSSCARPRATACFRICCCLLRRRCGLGGQWCWEHPPPQGAKEVRSMWVEHTVGAFWCLAGACSADVLGSGWARAGRACLASTRPPRTCPLGSARGCRRVCTCTCAYCVCSRALAIGGAGVTHVWSDADACRPRVLRSPAHARPRFCCRRVCSRTRRLPAVISLGRVCCG